MPVSSVWCVVCGVWRVACGVWRVACGVWRVACGVWRVACGVCACTCTWCAWHAHVLCMHACVTYSLHNNTHPLGEWHLNWYGNDAGGQTAVESTHERNRIAVWVDESHLEVENGTYWQPHLISSNQASFRGDMIQQEKLSQVHYLHWYYWVCNIELNVYVQ